MVQARQDTYQKQLEALAKQQQAANALLTTKPSGGTPSSSGRAHMIRPGSAIHTEERRPECPCLGICWVMLSL